MKDKYIVVIIAFVSFVASFLAFAVLIARIASTLKKDFRLFIFVILSLVLLFSTSILVILYFFPIDLIQHIHRHGAHQRRREEEKNHEEDDCCEA
jgi:CHASE2 domain-containing sensor protein